jgi:RecQ-mediated genome instability protein 1
MLVRSVIVARAVLLLEPESTQLLGGKVEPLHRAWLENRKAQLRAGMNGGAANGGGDAGHNAAGGGSGG